MSNCHEKPNWLRKSWLFMVVIALAFLIAGCGPTQFPFGRKLPCLNTTKYPIMPGTFDHESGFFSLCEAHNGKIYVGTATDGRNGYLIEFDPSTEKQRIVVDTNKLCGCSGTGITAQSKIHTINYVGPSGTIYMASKQGGVKEGQNPFWYPGGYIMTFDPATDKAECLGQVPIPGHGIIDVTADEQRGLIYVVTCDDGRSMDEDRQLWMLFDMKTREFRVLGPHLCRYAATLVGENGTAYAMTHNYNLASYEPDRNRVSVRRTYLPNKKKFDPINDPGENFATWCGADNNNTAFFMMLSQPGLYEIDISSSEANIPVVYHGKMINTNNFTGSLAALRVGRDGKVYNMIKDHLEKGVYHLIRFDRQSRKFEDTGIVNIDMKKRAGDLRNQGMTICRDGTIYATFISPFELHRLDDIKAITPQ